MPGLPPDIQGDAIAQLLVTKYGVPPEQVPAMQRAILNDQATNSAGLQSEALAATADKETERMAYLEMMGLLLNDREQLDPIAKKETDAFLEHGRNVTRGEATAADAKERIPEINSEVAPFRPRTTTVIKPGAAPATVQSGQPHDTVHKERLQRALAARKAFLGY
jgi:hypothetical protein